MLQNDNSRNPFNKSVGISMYAIESRFTRLTLGRSRGFQKKTLGAIEATEQKRTVVDLGGPNDPVEADSYIESMPLSQ